MAVKIRLTRMGAKGHPRYRIVATDSPFLPIIFPIFSSHTFICISTTFSLFSTLSTKIFSFSFMIDV